MEAYLSTAIEAVRDRSGSAEGKIKAVKALPRLVSAANAPEVLGTEDIVEAILRVCQIPNASLMELEPAMLAVLEKSCNPKGVKQLIAAYKHDDPQIAFAAAFFTMAAMDKDSIWERMVDADTLRGLVSMIQHSVVHCRGMAIAACFKLVNLEGGVPSKGAQFCAKLRKESQLNIVPELIQAIDKKALHGDAEGDMQPIYGKFELTAKTESVVETLPPLKMANARAIACRTLVAIATHDMKGVVAEISASDGLGVLVKAVLDSELNIGVKVYPLNVIRLLLDVTFTYQDPSQFEDLCFRLMKAEGFFAAMPSLIKSEWPFLAEHAILIVVACIAVYRRPSKRRKPSLRDPMVHIRTAAVEFLEARVHNSYLASELLLSMICAEDMAITLPLGENPARLVKELTDIMKANQPVKAWAACSLICKHLAFQAQSPALKGDLILTAMVNGFVPAIVPLLQLQDCVGALSPITSLWKEQHQWMMGLFQVLTVSEGNSMVEQAGGGASHPPMYKAAEYPWHTHWHGGRCRNICREAKTGCGRRRTSTVQSERARAEKRAGQHPGCRYSKGAGGGGSVARDSPC